MLVLLEGVFVNANSGGDRSVQVQKNFSSSEINTI